MLLAAIWSATRLDGRETLSPCPQSRGRKRTSSPAGSYCMTSRGAIMTHDEHQDCSVVVADVVVRYGRTVALDGLSLCLSSGVHGLLGPNGAGKTTLMRILATADSPRSGHVRLLGTDVLHAAGLRAVRRKLGYLPQVFGYYPHYKVHEFVEYMATLKEVPAPKLAAAVAKSLRRVGLTDRADAKMRTLSGGMLRRAGLAQAIVNDPRLLILDEPTAGLDPEQRVALRALLRDLGKDSTVLVSTHLVEDVAAICTSVTVMNQGRIRFVGTPTELVGSISDGEQGDTDMERGYASVLHGNTSQRWRAH